MASFSTAELMKPGRKTVSVRYTVKKDEINEKLEQPRDEGQKKRTETIESIILSGDGLEYLFTTGLSGTLTSSYSPIKMYSNSAKSASLKLELTYTVREYEAFFDSYNGDLLYETVKEETESIEELGDRVINGEFHDFQFESIESGGYRYWYEVYEIIYIQDWILYNENQFTITKTLTYYKSPEKFNFENCVSGKQWRVDSGINSLIRNINSFPAYATQWKAWKDQPNLSSPCPNFDSPLSANNLNSIYAYVGKTGNFNPGDPISAAMFNDLADVINNDA